MALSEITTLKMRNNAIKDEREQIMLRNTELNRVIARLKSLAHFTDEKPEAKAEREAFIAQYEAEFGVNTQKLKDLQAELTANRQRIFELNGNRHVPYV